jgi:penicillin G amidase
MRWIVRGLLGLLLLLAAAAVAAWLYMQRAAPVVDGTLTLPGALAEVRIERDAHGIPTIRAASAADVAYGLGVVHAQDRLWQLETHRRIGAGRLAEAFGESALPNDRFLRALGVRRAAEAQWAQAGAETRELLTAYAAGVNAVIGGALRARPPEFLILGLPVEDWTPVDSLAWAIMMAWDLGANWNNELRRLRLASALPTDRIEQLLPATPGEPPVALRDYAALYGELGLLAGARRVGWGELPEIAPPSGIEGTGSNNWVVAGTHTTTGQPLLANDPHLKLSAPALWYFARLQAPGLDVAGATLPGLPVVVLGQNARIAWGFTNTGPDVQDLYIEQVDPADPTRYRTPDGWARFEPVTETIRVKGGADVVLQARRTRHGPVISDAGTMDDAVGASHVLAMRWTALDADNDPVAVGMAMMRAASVAEFVAATDGWVAPMQSMVVADVDGAIGMVAPGRVPLRAPDNDLHGLAPAPGWEARYDWVGLVPVRETPREIDPPRGWIATANQRIVDPDYPHVLTREWTLPFRQQRIEQMLQARPTHSLDDLARMQADLVSLEVPRLLPWLQRARPEHPLAAAAQAQLAGFDGTMAADRAAPTIYWAWKGALVRALFADEVGAERIEELLGGRRFADVLETVLSTDDAWWCDDKATPLAETCAQQVDRAFAVALDGLSARRGGDPAAWRWGEVHELRAEHRPFSRVGPLRPLFELRAPLGGDTYTVNATRVVLRRGDLHTEHGPSLRALYDLADRGRSRVMSSSGQSGLPWQAAYRGFVAPWAAGATVPLWPAPEAAAAGGSLLIVPAAPAPAAR